MLSQFLYYALIRGSPATFILFGKRPELKQ